MATLSGVDDEMTLEELVTTNPLPQLAKVTVGWEDPNNSSNTFSTGDVIEVRRIACPVVSLTYVDSGTGNDVIVTVSTSNATRFRFPRPSTQRPRIYSTVKQLVDAWPLAVIARCGHKDRNPAFVVGDKLRLIRLDTSHHDGGNTVVLELKNLTTLELVHLPFSYSGAFAESAPIDKRLYTLGELAEIARVPRQLVLRHDDRSTAEAWIPGVPWDFSGYVWVSKPDYLVEVQPKTSLADAEDDDDEDKINSFLVSIDTEITVVACEPDYVSMADRECYLRQLANKPAGVFPRIASVISWKEETTTLQHHFVRPGDRLILYSLVTVRKLALSVGHRRFFVPLDHPEEFSILDDTSMAAGRLQQLVCSSTRFPLLLKLADRDGNYVNFEEVILPREEALKAEAIVNETAVVTAKINSTGCPQPSFRLPLRTKIALHFYGRWKESQVESSVSRYDAMAEEVSKSVYHEVTGTNWSGSPVRETVDFTAGLPAPMTAVWIETVFGTEATLGYNANGTASGRQVTVSESSVSDKPPPLFARASTLPRHTRPPPPPPPPSPPLPPTLTRHAAADLNRYYDDDAVAEYDGTGASAPFIPPRRPTSPLRPVPPSPLSPSYTSSHPPLSAEDNDDDTGDYESIDSDPDYEEVNDGNCAASVTQTESFAMPADGNVSQFSVKQLQQLMQQLNIAGSTLSEWSALNIDGRAFAKMSDSQLAAYKVDLPLVLYFRDRSRLHVLTTL